MQNIGSGFIVLGFAITLLAQIVGAIMVFNVSFVKGVLSLTIPGYFIVILRREGFYRAIIGGWLFGLVCIATGTILLS